QFGGAGVDSLSQFGQNFTSVGEELGYAGIDLYQPTFAYPSPYSANAVHTQGSGVNTCSSYLIVGSGVGTLQVHNITGPSGLYNITTGPLTATGTYNLSGGTVNLTGTA